MIRKAKIQDIKQIQELINYFASQDLMLPRSLNELYDNLRDFWVCEEDKKDYRMLCVAYLLGGFGRDKVFAVQKNRHKKGVAQQLMVTCIKEAKELGANKLFVLTYLPEYFRKFGFKRVRHSELPHKVWAECINCCKFPDCQEIALLKVL